MSRPRQAVVLAAGRGSRMGRSTDRQPKCLYLLAGRPILAWTMEALKLQGIEKVLIVGGWCAEALVPLGTELRVNAQWRTTNMVRSLAQASDWLQAAPTLVVYGDGAYGAQAMASVLEPSAHDLLVPIDTCWLELWRHRFENPLEDAETLVRQADRLLAIGQRPQGWHEVQGQFMGLLRTTPTGWRSIVQHMDGLVSEVGEAALDRLDMTGLLSSLLKGGTPLHAIEVAGGWVEIDSQADAAAVERALQDPGFSHDFRR